MASISTSGASASVLSAVDTTIYDATIDNSTRVYAVSVFCSGWAGSLTAIKGVKITYRMNGPE